MQATMMQPFIQHSSTPFIILKKLQFQLTGIEDKLIVQNIAAKRCTQQCFPPSRK
jgi:hypothetical protein